MIMQYFPTSDEYMSTSQMCLFNFFQNWVSYTTFLITTFVYKYWNLNQE